MNKKGAISILQIVILILGVVAISYAIGSSVKVVSSATDPGVIKIQNDLRKEAGLPPLPPVSTTPAHGVYGKALSLISKDFAASSAGFSTAGIIQGAGWEN